jgi:ribosomal protein S27E
MPPWYAARIADLGRSDFVKVDCVACHHEAC